MQIGRLRSAGLAKESVVGTLVTPPTEYLRFIPPDSFYPKITPLLSKAIGVLPDVNIKQTPGPGELTGLKMKLELESENCGNILNALFGADTLAESATFVIGASNNKIDFKEDAGTTRNATIASGTYIMGTTSGTVGTLCKAVKTALEAASGATGTYTVTYSYSTKKLTIAAGGAVTNIQILWLTGANNATAAYAVLGFTKVDTSNAASVTSNSTTTVAAFTHTFVRTAVSQLPTYSFWLDKNPLYPQLTGCMLNKFDIEIKAKELVTLDTDWTGLSYDATGTSKSPSYSAARPFAFNMGSISVDGSPSLDYDNLKVTINNMVKADHVIGSSRFPGKIYSEGFEVELSADLFFEDAVQYNKFLAGTTAAFIVTLTHTDDITGAASGVKPSLTLTLPNMVYKAANLPIPSGVLKIPFMATVMYDSSSGYTMNAVLKNSVATAY